MEVYPGFAGGGAGVKGVGYERRPAPRTHTSTPHQAPSILTPAKNLAPRRRRGALRLARRRRGTRPSSTPRNHQLVTPSLAPSPPSPRPQARRCSTTGTAPPRAWPRGTWASTRAAPARAPTRRGWTSWRASRCWQRARAAACRRWAKGLGGCLGWARGVGGGGVDLLARPVGTSHMTHLPPPPPPPPAVCHPSLWPARGRGRLPPDVRARNKGGASARPLPLSALRARGASRRPPVCAAPTADRLAASAGPRPHCLGNGARGVQPATGHRQHPSPYHGPPRCGRCPRAPTRRGWWCTPWARPSTRRPTAGGSSITWTSGARGGGGHF